MAKRPEASDQFLTDSYNLPVDLVDILRRLAQKRADDIRAARSQGLEVEGDARQSASKIVLDALTPHRAFWA